MLLLSKSNFNSLISIPLSYGKLLITGRDNTGRISTRHRGGTSVRRTFRIVDFYHYIWNVQAVVTLTVYDPNRSALLNLISFVNSVICFQLAPEGLFLYNRISNVNGSTVSEDRVGYSSFLKFIKPGTYIHCLEHKPLYGARYVRAASTYAKLVSSSAQHAIIKLRSHTLLKISTICVATIGVLSNKYKHMLIKTRNAGFTRRLGRRPSVRGVAMNPIDHPHGGGQGKTSGGRPSVTPWAEITKGKKTRRKVNYGAFILKR